MTGLLTVSNKITTSLYCHLSAHVISKVHM